MNDKLGKFGSLFCNFTNASCSILANLDVDILKAVENSGEDFCFNNNFSQVDGVFGNLSKTLANVSLKLSIGVGDECSKIWNGTLINDGLSEFFSVFSDF